MEVLCIFQGYFCRFVQFLKFGIDQILFRKRGSGRWKKYRKWTKIIANIQDDIFLITILCFIAWKIWSKQRNFKKSTFFIALTIIQKIIMLYFFGMSKLKKESKLPKCQLDFYAPCFWSAQSRSSLLCTRALKRCAIMAKGWAEAGLRLLCKVKSIQRKIDRKHFGLRPISL